MTEWLLTDLQIHITFSDGQSRQENRMTRPGERRVDGRVRVRGLADRRRQ